MDDRGPVAGTKRILDRGIEVLDAAMPGRGRLIDIPCGTGYLATRARESGWTVEAYDLFPELWQGDESTPALAVDLNQVFPIEDDRFDAVACCEGFEHVENPYHVLREFRRILSPGGLLLISIPNTIDIRQRFRFMRRGFLGHYPPDVPEHINAMGPYLLTVTLIGMGFEICRVTVASSYCRGWIRLIAPFFGLGKDSGLPPEVHSMLSSREVLTGRTALVLARCES